MFGDPCRGVTKYFELYYNCTKDKGENEVPTITPTMGGEEGGDDKLDGGRGGGERDGYSSNGNSKGPDDRVQTTTDGYKVNSDSSCENNNNSGDIQIDNEGNDDDHDDDDDDDDDDDSDDDNDGDDDDDDDGDCDDEDQKGLSAVAIVAIAAGIPIGVVITIAIIVILTCILASSFKRRKMLGRTDYRNMSVNQYDGQGLPMTASSNNEDSEMVYNSAYQSVSQDGQSAVKTMGNDKIDGMRINYENLSEVGSTNEEEAVYNETYQSINGNEPKR
ncbi:hypothetical protein HOLleu_23984 [Holothuria leucospilota]|uniref:Uncharacterized protein n=1 Tax=Holothuria leucospilota TaxID=206669 RepID=A0A9Q1BW43_HOLLE|nr:hypothetical protein HOLleu_23984 [Holothuria leucospilota]